eukprot:scaffold6281_cov149-Isochrysis_galbana.AAC.3
MSTTHCRPAGPLDLVGAREARPRRTTHAAGARARPNAAKARIPQGCVVMMNMSCGCVAVLDFGRGGRRWLTAKK